MIKKFFFGTIFFSFSVYGFSQAGSQNNSNAPAPSLMGTSSESNQKNATANPPTSSPTLMETKPTATEKPSAAALPPQPKLTSPNNKSKKSQQSK